MKYLSKFLFIIFSFALCMPGLLAQTNAVKSKSNQPNLAAGANINSQPKVSSTTPPLINAVGYILMDADSGQILAAKNPDARLEPASLTKVVTMYVVSDALQQGKIRLSDLVPISKEAWRTGGTRMFVQAGTQVPLQQLIDGIVVVSGNDAAVAVAEYVGGTMENFVNMMNQTAIKLGMKNSHFSDVNGLPISNHFTSPRDLAILTRALIENFPQNYKWYGQKWFVYNNIKQANRNRLLWQDPTVDGLKTGHTGGAGYCLIASANRGGMRLISVVMGAPTPSARLKDSLSLLNWGFRNYSTHQLFLADQTLATARVWYGENKKIPLGLPQGLYVTIPNGQYQNLKAMLTINSKELTAPITKGEACGKVNVTIGDQLLLAQPIVALENNPRGNIFDLLRDRIELLFHQEEA